MRSVLQASGAGAFGLLRVGDQHVEAEALERVVDMTRSRHRLDDAAHRLAVAGEAAVEVAKAVAVGRRCELVDQLALVP